jgi:hypothetical protein
MALQFDLFLLQGNHIVNENRADEACSANEETTHHLALLKLSLEFFELSFRLFKKIFFLIDLFE